MGIFGNDDEHEEIDLDAELAAADVPAEEPAAPALVKIRVIAQHNGLRRGDIISVAPERGEAMVKAGVGEVIA